MRRTKCARAVAACRSGSGRDWKRVRSASLCRREVRCRSRMPRSHRQPPPAPRAPAANAAEPKSDGVLAMTFKIFLLFAGLMVKVPVGLYFSCKLLLFQSLMLMSPEDSAFYATIVSVVGLHVVLAIFVFIVWKEGLPQWRENKND